ncbi:MAG TPA: hypothetical protein PKZ75_05430 [Bacteroidia bacterium]|nr:hypothetical protein [Bacteroidia bacterium]
MTKLKLYSSVIILLSFVFFIQCSPNKDLQRITSIENYFEFKESSALDTNGIRNAPNLITNIEKTDSLSGRYSFIVYPGYHGHSLILNRDSSFIESMWTDVLKKRKKAKGKWFVKNNHLILKQSRKKEYSFIIYKYSWTTFLVPVLKEKYFSVKFQENKYKLDSLKNKILEVKGYQLDKTLRPFQYLCFYRRPK